VDINNPKLTLSSCISPVELAEVSDHHYPGGAQQGGHAATGELPQPQPAAHPHSPPHLVRETRRERTRISHQLGEKCPW